LKSLYSKLEKEKPPPHASYLTQLLINRNTHCTLTWPSLLIFTGLLSFQGFLRSWQAENSRVPLLEKQTKKATW